MKDSTGLYPRVRVDQRGAGSVSQAGAVLLTETIRATGLDHALSQAMGPWRKPTAVHDPAKVLLDLAVSLAVGGDCLADVAVLRGQPGVFGLVASDPTVSRTIDALAAEAGHALTVISSARAAARRVAWSAAGKQAPDHDVDAARPLIIDVDATLVTSHSEKEHAAPTFKKGYGFHPLWAFVDHGSEGTGEPLAFLLRRGNAGSNTAADHITVVQEALRQLPSHRTGRRPGRPGKKVLVRADGAGCTHEFLTWLTRQRLSYSVGFTLPTDFEKTLTRIPKAAWTPAYNSDGDGERNGGIREGAFVAEVTGMLDLTGWPPGMRVILRKEHPHPGAQLRITDINGDRVTAFATNSRPGGMRTQLADLELRHRRRARAEDRIRVAKDTGLRNLPMHDFNQNRIWCAIVTLACELTAWMQLLALTAHPARRWEPKRLRLRLFSTAGRLARTGRRVLLHLGGPDSWTGLITDGITRLRALAVPG